MRQRRTPGRNRAARRASRGGAPRRAQRRGATRPRRRWEPLAAIGLGLIATVALSYLASLAWRAWAAGTHEGGAAAAPRPPISHRATGAESPSA